MIIMRNCRERGERKERMLIDWLETLKWKDLGIQRCGEWMFLFFFFLFSFFFFLFSFPFPFLFVFLCLCLIYSVCLFVCFLFWIIGLTAFSLWRHLNTFSSFLPSLANRNNQHSNIFSSIYTYIYLFTLIYIYFFLRYKLLHSWPKKYFIYIVHLVGILHLICNLGVWIQNLPIIQFKRWISNH
jgi:hypothetical protein